MSITPGRFSIRFVFWILKLNFFSPAKVLYISSCHLSLLSHYPWKFKKWQKLYCHCVRYNYIYVRKLSVLFRKARRRAHLSVGHNWSRTVGARRVTWIWLNARERCHISARSSTISPWSTRRIPTLRTVRFLISCSQIFIFQVILPTIRIFTAFTCHTTTSTSRIFSLFCHKEFLSSTPNLFLCLVGRQIFLNIPRIP